MSLVALFSSLFSKGKLFQALGTRLWCSRHLKSYFIIAPIVSLMQRSFCSSRRCYSPFGNCNWNKKEFGLHNHQETYWKGAVAIWPFYKSSFDVFLFVVGLTNWTGVGNESDSGQMETTQNVAGWTSETFAEAMKGFLFCGPQLLISTTEYPTYSNYRSMYPATAIF